MTTGPVARTTVRENAWALVLLFLAANLWVAALFMVDRATLTAMSDLGLAPHLPWPFYAALLALLVGFALLVRRPTPHVPLAVGHLVLLLSMWHATPAILYGTPRYPFTYKHIGISAYIQQHGSIDPNIDAYFNWPGFFSLAAFASDLSGLDTPFVEAVFAPVLMNVFIVAGLVVLLSGLTRDKRVVWFGAWLYLLANWVGQDYFAPQAFAYGLHLAILGLFVGYFVRQRWRSREPRPDAAIDPAPLLTASPRVKAGTLMVMSVMFAAIVAAHQLTPFMTIASVGVLVLIGLAQARLFFLLMLGLQLAWFSYMAHTYFAGHLGSLLASVGRLLENVTIASEVLAPTAAATLSPERLLVLDVRQWLTLFVAVIAVIGWMQLLRRGRLEWVPMALAAVPVGMVALQPYGGEIIMRIFLFSVPLLAYFAASAFFPAAGQPPRRGATVLIVVATAVMAGGMAVAYYGNESMNYVAQDELEVLDDLYATAPAGALIVTQTDNPPTRHTRYDEFEYLTLGALAGDLHIVDGSLPVDALAAAMSDAGGADTFLLLTRSQTANARLFGYLGGIDWAAFEAAITESELFEDVLHTDGGTVFRLATSRGTTSQDSTTPDTAEERPR